MQKNELVAVLKSAPDNADVVAYWPGDPSVGIFEGTWTVTEISGIRGQNILFCDSADVPPYTAGTLARDLNVFFDDSVPVTVTVPDFEEGETVPVSRAWLVSASEDEEDTTRPFVVLELEI